VKVPWGRGGEKWCCRIVVAGGAAIAGFTEAVGTRVAEIVT